MTFPECHKLEIALRQAHVEDIQSRTCIIQKPSSALFRFKALTAEPNRSPPIAVASEQRAV